MLKPLIWKEWHEQRWKLAFGTVMLVFFTGAMLAARLTTSREVVVVVWILGGLVLSLYSAMGVFAPEVTNKTKLFLASKPARPWQVFAVKWFFGWLNFAVPMLLCSLILAILSLSQQAERQSLEGCQGTGLALAISLSQQAGDFFPFNYIVRGTCAGLALGTLFYSMTCCLAPSKSGEAFVGFIGCIIFLCYMLHIVLIGNTIIETSYITGLLTFARKVILFINPLSWIHLIKSLHGDPLLNLYLFIEQAILFIITIFIGFRKWQRSTSL